MVVSTRAGQPRQGNLARQPGMGIVFAQTGARAQPVRVSCATETSLRCKVSPAGRPSRPVTYKRVVHQNRPMSRR
jgi:hypothetical protein